jgi:DNA-binding transcriptional LysR family regulator
MNDVDGSIRKLTNLDLNLVLALHALLDTGSVTASARRLGRTQSSVSHALARLRELLGDELLVRVGRGLAPTPRARELAPVVAAAVAGLGRVFADRTPFDPATSATRFGVLCPDLLAPLIPDLVVRLAERAPRIELAFDPPAPVDALARGSADLALGVAFDAESPDLHLRPLGAVTFAAVARKGHPGAPFALDAWVRWPHVVVRTGRSTPNLVQGRLDALGVRRTIGLTVPSFLMALHGVARTDLLLAAPRELVDELVGPLGLEIHPLPVEVAPVPVAMIWHARSQGDPAHRWLRDEIGSALASRLAPAPSAY